MKKYVVFEFDHKLYSEIARNVLCMSNEVEITDWVKKQFDGFLAAIADLSERDVILADNHKISFETRYGVLTVAQKMTTVDGIAIRCSNCDALLEMSPEKPVGDSYR